MSCDLDHLHKLKFPLQMEAPDEYKKEKLRSCFKSSVNFEMKEAWTHRSV